MNRFTLLLLLALVCGGLVACDTYEQDDYRPEVVVESYLVAEAPLPEVRVSMTAPITAHYTFEAFAVEGANVVMNLLDENGAVEESFSYVQSAPGIYRPADGNAVVMPLRRYALEVRVPDQDDVVRSETLVPGLFEMLDLSADTVVYQSAEQVEARVTNSLYPGRKSIYLFTIEAQDTVNFDLTPFYKDMVDDDDGGLTRSDLVRNASGLTSEADFTSNPDGTLSLKLPWIGVAFYGPNLLVANALDDNLFDFKRSQLGGGGSPGEMDNLLDHVENGRGIFGSMARDQAIVFVRQQGD